LVTSCAQVSLYDIPELEPVQTRVAPKVVPVKPIWTRGYEDRYNYPPVSPVYWDKFSGRHEKPIVLFTGSNLRFFHQSRIDQSPSYYFLDSFWLRRYSLSSIETKPTLSDRRVIWSENGHLHTCVFPLTYGGQYDAALLRFGYALTETGSDLRIAPIELEVGGEIRDVSWDEPSGRLCVLVENITSSRKVLIINSV
jgi:hypothetical protein